MKANFWVLILSFCMAGTAEAQQSAFPTATNMPVINNAAKIAELRAKAEKGEAAAQSELGLMYDLGQGVTQDYAEAVKWLRKAADQGSAQAQYNLGVCYFRGHGVLEDYAEAVKWYRKAAVQSDPMAQYNLGVCCFQGQGVAQDYTEAVKWYRKAAEQGQSEAQYNLALCYDDGRGVVQDFAEAVKWFQKAAEQGDAKAQYNLGFCYSKGNGVTQDYTESAKWYRKAAEQGNSKAQFSVGIRYEYGRGVPQDYAEAVKWYQKAAEQGNADAQDNLGYCYDEGHGVQKDYAEAVKWYRKAAEQGNVDGQDNLGASYDSGQGVPENDIEAYKWFSLAAAQGNEHAANAKESLSRRMIREEIVEGQRRAAAFVPRINSSENSEAPVPSPQPGVADSEQKASGTAFFISNDGYLLTAFHVIENANRIVIKTKTATVTASLVKVDKANDIALLKVVGSFHALPLAKNHDWTQGQSVFTIGFPNIELQGAEPKLTKGEINSLSGIQDDPREFQISVSVQPGNSGGPLVTLFGNVIGIVTARLSDAATFEASGALPQNVNYATKISYADPLLESIPDLAGKLKMPYPTQEKKFDDAVQEAREATALVLTY